MTMHAGSVRRIRVETHGRTQLQNRLRLLRSLDREMSQYEMSLIQDWQEFRRNPAEYLTSCDAIEAECIWAALRRREGRA